MEATGTVPRASTGVAGFDGILGGGLPAGRMYLLEGAPGTGKTTLALQFLLEGARRGESCVYVTLSETSTELHDVARSHGWDLGKLTVCDLQQNEETLQAESQYTLFHPSEVELTEATKAVLETVERVNPSRVVFDSLSEMRLLARDSLRYRRQVLALKHYFSQRECSVLLVDTPDETTGFQLASISHGVIELQHVTLDYGSQRRRMRVHKVRGVPFREGFHDYVIRTGGVTVFPRLIAAEHAATPKMQQLSSGVPELDQMLNGGLESGTAALLQGPSGVGKSTIAMQYAFAAAKRGEPSVVYLFDEAQETWLRRGKGLGLGLDEHVRSGKIQLVTVDPSELSPGEFAHQVRHAVDGDGARLVILDSLNGYRAAMVEERHLTLHLHELLSFLGRRGVVTLMVLAEHGLVGQALASDADLSYLADTVLLMRYFEAFGQVRGIISVVKKRIGGHEKKIREFGLGPPRGVQVGEELSSFRGVLSGAPEYTGPAPALLGSSHGKAD